LDFVTSPTEWNSAASNWPGTHSIRNRIKDAVSIYRKGVPFQINHIYQKGQKSGISMEKIFIMTVLDLPKNILNNV
jgi:hypothetical protein